MIRRLTLANNYFLPLLFSSWLYFYTICVLEFMGLREVLSEVMPLKPECLNLINTHYINFSHTVFQILCSVVR